MTGMQVLPSSTVTGRGRAKEARRAAFLREAARLFARDGYAGVSLEDIGQAVGVRGPAVYRHFPNKAALLEELLVEVSERLLAGGREVVADPLHPSSPLRRLVSFQVAFAIAEPDVIRVQDRDLHSVGDQGRHRVRRLQREYVELWVEALSRERPGDQPDDLRVRAHAGFGLINSTPYSLRSLRQAPAGAEVAAALQSMVMAALLS
jgi:AcrR family transcriptional regulator